LLYSQPVEFEVGLVHDAAKSRQPADAANINFLLVFIVLINGERKLISIFIIRM
jgi:hypothetical protein